jgi:dTDP-glucose 4,6-dehydratase/UDP-glucose 4,6-dehydratase
MPIVITRGNNVYGPNQYPEKVIPKFIKLLKDDKKVTIQGDGNCIRAFLHSTDVVKAFELILEKGIVGEIYNIGCDEGMEYSVMDVAKILIEKIKDTKEYDEWITYVEDRPFNDQRYYISNPLIIFFCIFYLFNKYFCYIHNTIFHTFITTYIIYFTHNTFL